MKEKGSISPKLLTLIKNAVCIVIMLVILAMSFGTIFTMTPPKSGKAVDIFDKVINSVGDGEAVSMPDEVDISIPFIVKSVGSAGKVIKSAIETAKSASEAKDALEDAQSEVSDDPNAIDDVKSDIDENINELEENANELSENLRDESFVGFIALISAIMGAFTENIFLALIYFALIGIVVSFPIIIAIRLIISVCSFFIHIAAPSKSVNTISKAYKAVIALFPALLFIKIVAPDVTYASSVGVMAALLAVGIVLGIVISRLRKYTPAQLKYVNLVQIISVVSLAGYAMFLAGFSKMGLFDAIWDGFSSFMRRSNAINMLVFFVILMATIALLMLALKHIKNIACRLACMLPTPKEKKNKPIKKFAKDSFVPTAAASLALIAVPFVLPIIGFELDMGDGMASFALFALGISVMFISEIVMATLKKPICAGLTPEDVKSVLSGYTDSAHVADTVTAPVNEAPAEEAPTEETPAEEIPTEEAPIEEASEAVEETEAVAEAESEPKVSIELTPDEEEAPVE